MKARHILIGVIWLNILVASATAETTVIRPDPCPAPANAPKIIMFLGPDAEDNNPDRADVDDVVVYFAVPTTGWASARLLARFDVEGEKRRPFKLVQCQSANMDPR